MSFEGHRLPENTFWNSFFVNDFIAKYRFRGLRAFWVNYCTRSSMQQEKSKIDSEWCVVLQPLTSYFLPLPSQYIVRFVFHRLHTEYDDDQYFPNKRLKEFFHGCLVFHVGLVKWLPFNPRPPSHPPSDRKLFIFSLAPSALAMQFLPFTGVQCVAFRSWTTVFWYQFWYFLKPLSRHCAHCWGRFNYYDFLNDHQYEPITFVCWKWYTK